MSSKVIYFSKKQKMAMSDKKIKQIELNRSCFDIKHLLRKAGMTQKQLYDFLKSRMIKTGVFCKVENKKYIPKSFRTFRKYISNCGARKWNANLNEREKLINFIYNEWSAELVEFSHIIKKRSFNNDIRILKQFLKNPNNKEHEEKVDRILKRDGDLEDSLDFGFTKDIMEGFIEKYSK
jgi:hypothetical protein